MATVIAYPILEASKFFSDNRLPYFLTFNKSVDYAAWNVVSGSGIATNDPSISYKGDRSLYLFSTDDAVDMEANSGGTQTRFTATQTKRHVLQFWVNNPSLGVTTGQLVTVKVAKNGAGNWAQLKVNAEQLNGQVNTWVGFYYDFLLDAGDYLDFSFVLEANTNYPVSGNHAVQIDGLKIDVDDRNLGYPSEYSEPPISLVPVPTVDGYYMYRADVGYPTLIKVLEGSSALNFPSIANGEYADLAIETSGALEYGAVTVKPSYLAVASGLSFVGFVDSADSVTVRAYNNTGSTVDLASTTFRVLVIPNL